MPIRGMAVRGRVKPGLLVSVVDAREAADAAGAGADVIDAKDPSRGALGAVGPRMLAEIVQACPPGVETSAALGDLGELEALRRTWSAEAPLPAGLTYVKVGLGGFPDAADAGRALLALTRSPAPQGAGRGPRLVIAAYADHARAQAPPAHQVPDLALQAGAYGCLLDTAGKDGSCLFDWIDLAQLSRFVEACRARDLLCALAGSLRAEHLPRLAGLAPDLIGVRGAACDGDRVLGRVSSARVASLAGALQGH